MADNILEVRGVTVSFDGFKALDGLDFALGYGELRFLIGPNGAGKTTLLDIITGKTRPDQGTLIFDRRTDLRLLPEHRRVRQGIGRKFQTPAIFGSLTVQENLEAAVGFRDGLPALLRPSSARQRAEVADTLAQIGLGQRAGVRAGLLSHGEKQWLEIGMLLIQQPKLLLLDEPVAGMTRRERDRTGDLLQAIARERAVLVVEHDMEFVRRFAQTVTVLHTGRMLCEGPVEQVQNDPRVIEVYLGRAHARQGEAQGGVAC
ncbi:MAG: urea ABC transporter ATP-binding protein UrtD [Roseiflexaceae bacterium]